MEIISCGREGIEEILAPLRKGGYSSRMSKYCIESKVENGYLIYNVLTCAMVWIDDEEYSRINELQLPKTFFAPQKSDEKEHADFVRWVLETRRKKTEQITTYTIFPTTDCNARCFYCFELGRKRIPMSRDIAEKSARYIINHCGGKKVNLRWFGGEPLYNREAIETICAILRSENLEYKSSVISNGYLFDADTVKNAVEEWNLKSVQITLDGTEDTYNRVKAFVYKNVNPYRTVMENIGLLLDAGVEVQIRLNMDLYNAEDLMKLVEELAERFGKRKGIFVYAHHIFKGNEAMADSHTEEEWTERTREMIRLEKKIRECGMESKTGTPKRIRLNYCMADSGSAVTIMPDGHVGLCEHFSDNEFIGHIDREGFDAAVVKSWKERMPELQECADCALYPECIQLKKCPNGGKCFQVLREEKIRKLKRKMLNEYEKWKKQQVSEENDEDELC